MVWRHDDVVRLLELLDKRKLLDDAATAREESVEEERLRGSRRSLLGGSLLPPAAAAFSSATFAFSWRDFASVAFSPFSSVFGFEDVQLLVWASTWVGVLGFGVSVMDYPVVMCLLWGWVALCFPSVI